MKMLKRLATLMLIAVVSIGPSLVLSGCENDSGLEEAAEETQDAVEDTAEEVEDEM
mgnify:CR=1 FL=1